MNIIYERTRTVRVRKVRMKDGKEKWSHSFEDDDMEPHTEKFDTAEEAVRDFINEVKQGTLEFLPDTRSVRRTLPLKAKHWSCRYQSDFWGTPDEKEWKEFKEGKLELYRIEHEITVDKIERTKADIGKIFEMEMMKHEL